MADGMGDGDAFGSRDHLSKAEQASANIAKNLERARDASEKMLANLKTAASLRINPNIGGGGGGRTQQATVRGNGNTGQAKPSATTQTKVHSEAGDGASGMQGTQNAHVVKDTADDPNWLARRQGRINAMVALGNAAINIPLGAFNDLRVGADQALQFEQNLLIARNGMGSFAQAKQLITDSAGRYNVRDVEAFNRNMAMALNANWGAGFGGGSAGNAKAAEAMAGAQTLASMAGLSPDAASSAAGALYTSENYYTAMASGIMTRDPATGDMLSPAEIINQIRNIYTKGKTREEIERGFTPGSGFAKMIMNISGGDPGMFKMIQTGLLVSAETGNPVSDNFEEEAKKYFDEDYMAGTLGQLNYNRSEAEKISEYAGVAGEGAKFAYDQLAKLNDTLTAQGEDSWFGQATKIGAGFDVLGTEMPNLTSAITSLTSALWAAVPLMMTGMMSDGLMNGGRGGRRGPGGRGGRGPGGGSPGSPGSRGMGGRLLSGAKFAGTRLLPAAGIVGATEAAVNWMQPDNPAENWSQWDSAKTIGSRALGYAGAGWTMGGPFGALAGGIIGLGTGAYDAWQNEKLSGNEGIATMLSNPFTGLGLVMQAADFLFNRQSSGAMPETSVPHYSEGEWFVPKDEQAKVHYGEMILPNRVAQAVRDEMSRGRTDSPGSGPRGSSPQVIINLSIQRASEREAMWLAGRVKGLIESDDELVSIGAGRFG